MLCKFVLIIDEVSYELSNSAIKNWKEVSYSLKRTDYSGITRTFTSKFEFINDAYDLLLSEYRQQYLMAAAMIEVYTVTNNHEYELRFRCPLDFSSMKIEAGVLSMNSVDDSIASLIKSQKGTQFEYLVKDMKEAKQLYYDRLELRNNIKYVIVGDKTDDNGNSILSLALIRITLLMKRMLLLNTHLLRLLKGVAFYIWIFPETNRHTLFRI